MSIKSNDMKNVLGFVLLGIASTVFCSNKYFYAMSMLSTWFNNLVIWFFYTLVKCVMPMHSMKSMSDMWFFTKWQIKAW